jgi:hypothetical protein
MNINLTNVKRQLITPIGGWKLCCWLGNQQRRKVSPTRPRL